jgi:nucleoside-diphosphate-sugar epimerase
MSESLHGRTVLVTGAGGFVGRGTVRRLVAGGARVRALAGPPGVPIESLDAGVEELRGEISNAAHMRDAVAGATTVVHLAGPASVADSFADPAAYARIHVEGTATLLSACVAAGVSRFVHISSAEVYGRPRSNPVRETHPLRARSPYGAAKIGAEQYVRAAAVSGLKAVILRPFSIYGPGLSPRSVIGTILRQCSESDEIRLHDLRPVRDYCFVDDIADAIAAAATIPVRSIETINVGSGTGRSVADLARTVLEMCGRHGSIVESAAGRRPPAADIPALVADVSRARARLHWSAQVDLRTGLERTLSSFGIDSTPATGGAPRPAGRSGRMRRPSKRYVITGAQGFLGRYVACHLLRSDPGCEVVGLGRSPRCDGTFTHAVSWGRHHVPAPVPPAIRAALASPRYRYVSCDILDGAGVRRTLSASEPIAIFHLASGLRGDRTRQLCRTVVEGVASLLEAAADVCAGARVVLGSSGAVYGLAANGNGRFHEADQCAPVDTYGAAKYAAEQVARALARERRVPLICARLFNLAGPGQDERHVCGYLASRIAAIQSGALSPHLDIGDATATRDFMDVRDAARGIALIAERGEPGAVYNVGTGAEIPVSRVLATLIGLAPEGDRIVIATRPGTRPSTVRRHAAHTTRLEDLGFRIEYDLSATLADLLNYYLHVVADSAPDA